MKKVIFLCLMVSLLVLSSCGKGTGRVENVKFQTGTKGLSIDFLEKGRSKQVFEEGTMYATFELRNEGFSDISQGILVPSLEKDFIELDSWELPREFRTEGDFVIFNLKGKSLSYAKGEKDIVSAILKAKRIDDTRNKIESRIILNACYAYATIFTETICIDTDPNELGIAEKTCKAQDITSSGQGAPVAITKVEQKILPGTSKDNVRLQLTIFVENKDDGMIIDSDRYKDICLGRSAGKDDYNVVKLKSLKFSYYEYGENSDFECTPNPLKETKNGYYTQCILKEGSAIEKSKVTFQTPLVIELEYGYKTTLSEKIEILNKEQDVT